MCIFNRIKGVAVTYYFDISFNNDLTSYIALLALKRRSFSIQDSCLFFFDCRLHYAIIKEGMANLWLGTCMQHLCSCHNLCWPMGVDANDLEAKPFSCVGLPNLLSYGMGLIHVCPRISCGSL